MKYLKIIRYIRPKTLMAMLSPIFLGTALSFKNGLFSLDLFLMTLITGLLLQIGTNLANDYYDGIKGTDSNRIKGPKRLSQQSDIPMVFVKHSFIFIKPIFNFQRRNSNLNYCRIFNIFWNILF